MGLLILYLDTILVPLSLFLTIGYHAYLWGNFRRKPAITTVGLQTLRRRSWLHANYQGDDKKGMLAVQSLRNTLMGSILTATITILLTVSMAALMNNAYKGIHVLSGSSLFGSQSGGIAVVKYGAASMFLVGSFVFSSMAVSCLIDANYVINTPPEKFSAAYIETVFERGFILAVVGNRLLCVAFPLILWMFGPLPVLVVSIVMVWVLYGLDFVIAFNFQIK
ncbi:uncharacterized protein LOC124940464 [Impatiens glandulifera]|uniref:uncharacterized protein LOC124940464 n=1 Tax=Impatiens glandulifera TaxID=253017 RepID=UPI001FB150AC|nr:uncharacterized protein LOC124940464 [Impatiens glandulifera]